MIYALMSNVVASGIQTKEELYEVLDVYVMFNRITPVQYGELALLIEQKYPPVTPPTEPAEPVAPETPQNPPPDEIVTQP